MESSLEDIKQLLQSGLDSASKRAKKEPEEMQVNESIEDDWFGEEVDETEDVDDAEDSSLSSCIRSDPSVAEAVQMCPRSRRSLSEEDKKYVLEVLDSVRDAIRKNNLNTSAKVSELTLTRKAIQQTVKLLKGEFGFFDLEYRNLYNWCVNAYNVPRKLGKRSRDL